MLVAVGNVSIITAIPSETICKEIFGTVMCYPFQLYFPHLIVVSFQRVVVLLFRLAYRCFAIPFLWSNIHRMLSLLPGWMR